MAKNSKGKSVNLRATLITLLVFGVLLLMTKYSVWIHFPDDYKFTEKNNTPATTVSKTASTTVRVHFIDVGQGSSTLIQSGTDGILIDAGEREYADTVIQYINQCGVTRLRYVVATHPHTDHIGALSDVIEAVRTENIIMPKLSKKNIPTTSAYKRLLKTVQSKEINAIAAVPGEVYAISKAKIEILGPLQQDQNLNNMSVVCKLTVYETKMMLLGDAENAELKSITQNGGDFQSDVILMGHHGSSTSIYEPFLDLVDAKVAVISCGKDNEYGHPHRETLEYLKKHKIKTYRTDESSTIVINCNEKNYHIQKAS